LALYTCSGCAVDASCNRGAPVPIVKVTDHYKDPPDDKRSNRTVAGELGVSEKTVRRAKDGLIAAGAAIDQVSGADGKPYPARRKAKEPEETSIDNPPKGPAPWADQDASGEDGCFNAMLNSESMDQSPC